MDAVLIDEELIAPARLRELSQRKNGPSVRRFAAQTLVYFGSAVALVLVEPWWLLVPLLLISGVIQFAMFGPCTGAATTPCSPAARSTAWPAGSPRSPSR